MTKKYYHIIVVIVSMIFIVTGCVGNITPSDTMKSPEYKSEDSVFNLYKKRLRENKSPEELLKFLKNHISKFKSEDNADIAITRVIELQESLLPKYEEKALEYSDDLTKLGEEIEEIQLTNEEKEWMTDAEANGYKIIQANVKIDYEKINAVASDYVSEELKDYIKIESDDYGNNYGNNKYNYSEKEYLDELVKKDEPMETRLNNLAIHLDELAKRISQTYIYIEKHKNSPYLLRVKELRKMYLEIYLFGSPNNSSFLYYKGYSLSNNKLQDTWGINYKNLEDNSQKWENSLQSNDKGTMLSKEFSNAIKNYKTELSKNDWMLSKSVYDYINGIINHNISTIN